MKQTTKKHIYDILKESIISGKIEPGEILNVTEVAEKNKVGKTPAREALLLLTHENLLTAMPRVGFVVTKLTLNDFFEICFLRGILESEAIGLAAERITPEEIILLEKNNQKEAEILVENSEQMTSDAYQLNREFHGIIAKASGNSRLEKMVNALLDDMERALSFDPVIADPGQHTEIIDSLKAHDKERAQKAIKAHLEETKKRILQMF